MKIEHLIFTMLITLFTINGQNNKAIKWINEKSIEIEDANPDSELVIFKNNTPNKFANAKIYGFGEASHNTKEFFNLKAKFFKYLAKTQGLKTFIMEESYQAESGINEWLNGGKGDIKTIAKNFNIGFWCSKEIVNLLQWMRDYNFNKPKEERIRFYGMDIQTGKKINEQIRKYVNDNNIKVDENFLTIADNCANKIIDFSKKDDWWKMQIPKLNELKQKLINSKTNNNEYKYILRSLDYLISYAQFASLTGEQYPKRTKFRDFKMFANVKWIVDNQSKNEKIFIWAHNEHINKKEMYYYGSGITNLGRHLKDFYNNRYYSIGFDFGAGKIDGFVIDKKKGNYWKTYNIEKPFKRTYAKTLSCVKKDIYFIDLQKANENEATKFFNTKQKQLLIAAGGYKPKSIHKIMMNKIYSETYDGLIFVKNISTANYNLNEL